MNFICSVNTSVIPHLHPEQGKIAKGGNFTAFNSGWESKDVAAQELSTILSTQAGLCAWHLVNGQRKASGTGVLQAGLIIIDIDNQAEGKDENGNKIQKQELTPEEALELDICKKYLTIGYHSPSDSPGWPRFRLVFGLGKAIIDPQFYQWFNKQILKQIPGSDIRATTVPNLFYGPKNKECIFVTTDKFIPEEVINEGFRSYSSLPVQNLEEAGDPEQAIDNVVIRANGIDIEKLVSSSVRSVLAGEEVSDRSSTMATVFKELIGWSNWLKEQHIASCVSPLTIAQDAFHNIYDYPHSCDGKFSRILNSIRNPEDLLPAVSLASEHGDLGIWKKIRRVKKSVFDSHASEEVKDRLAALKKEAAVNAVMNMAEFSLNNLESDYDEPESTSKSTPTSTSTSTLKENQVNTPATPAQLVSLQAGSRNREFSENDIATLIVNNQGDNFIYDSNLDQFYHYDDDLDIWYFQDEQHIKRRIVLALDALIAGGALPKYNSATISSVFGILKAKLLKSAEGGRRSIWSKSFGFIPFRNGVLCTKTFKFSEGKQKDLFLRHKLAYEYNTSAECPEFMKWIKGALDKDQEKLIQAFARAILTGYTAGERFLHLVGPGGTGKSTMQQLMVALAGFHGTHTSSLEVIETNKFESYNLIGKRLLLLTDESNYNKRMDVLKKLTSASDTLRAERKYGKEIISFKPECLVCIASNEHITSNDSSSGLERRRLTIVMDKVVDPSKRTELISVFEDRIEGSFVPEMSGIVSWALSMDYAIMKDILANPTKHVPSLNKTNIEALLFNNQFIAWLNDCCLYAPNTITPVGAGARKPNTDEGEKGMYVSNAYGALYPSYANFCKSCGYKPAAKHRFVERTKEALTNILKLPGTKVVLNDGIPGIKGLRLKAYDLNSDRAAKGPERLPTPVEFAQDMSTNRWDTSFQKHDTPKS
jgi:putative DNA primase/helicase